MTSWFYEFIPTACDAIDVSEGLLSVDLRAGGVLKSSGAGSTGSASFTPKVRRLAGAEDCWGGLMAMEWKPDSPGSGSLKSMPESISSSKISMDGIGAQWVTRCDQIPQTKIWTFWASQTENGFKLMNEWMLMNFISHERSRSSRHVWRWYQPQYYNFWKFSRVPTVWSRSFFSHPQVCCWLRGS